MLVVTLLTAAALGGGHVLAASRGSLTVQKGTVNGALAEGVTLAVTWIVCHPLQNGSSILRIQDGDKSYDLWSNRSCQQWVAGGARLLCSLAALVEKKALEFGVPIYLARALSYSANCQ